MLCLFFISTFSHAKQAYFDAGIHFGGAKVDRVQLAGGAGSTDIGTGDVFSLSLGYAYTPISEIDIQLGIGFRGNTAIGEENNVKWSSNFIESSAYYNLNDFRIGSGIQHYINPELRGGTINRDFENTNAYFITLEYKLYQSILIGFRITSEEYIDEATRENISGNTFGVTLVITQ